MNAATCRRCLATSRAPIALRWAARAYRAPRGPRSARRIAPVASGSHPLRPVAASALHHENEKSATASASVPVNIPRDEQGVVQPQDPAAVVLTHSGLVVVRQLEMLNVFIGYEQANKYAIMDPAGQTVGYIAEEEAGFAASLSRQFLRTHRPFRCTVMDAQGQVLFRVNRPFSWINSRITISLGEDESNIVGECQQEWHPYRRRYNLFLKKQGADHFEQFARIDAGLWAWTFDAFDAESKIMASINRNWAGFGRELFTDTGQYALRFDSVALEAGIAPPEAGPDKSAAMTGSTEHAPEESKQLAVHQDLTLDQRAVLLASAVTCDIDYFSRHSGSGGGFGMMPFMFPFGGSGEGSSDAQTGSEGGSPEDSTSAPASNPSSLSSSAEDQPLPRSAEADQAADQHGWDSWQSDMQQRQETEVLDDPWASEEDQQPGWGDFFGDDSEGE